MDGIANVAKQQQTQIDTKVENHNNNKKAEQAVAHHASIIEQMQKADASSDNKINSKKQVEELVKEMNKTLAPLNTSLKFGVDRDDVFFVSVIDTETNRQIRRFPAKKAAEFLPKMQELSGILFDTKG
ncbi:possible flagellar protein [hydrothermal vent metagenome]|uniref:Possible flagellar protein n=1 Tax=hydrothermal vent metagenome TaxID=652676 RepID=A0A1W1D4X1_9ZZZZ